MEHNPHPDMLQVMELLNETCKHMAEKIRLQEREIQRLREHREENRGSAGTEAKNFRVN